MNEIRIRNIQIFLLFQYGTIKKCLPFTAGNNFNYLRKDGNNVNIVVDSNQGGIGYGSSSLMYLFTQYKLKIDLNKVFLVCNFGGALNEKKYILDVCNILFAGAYFLWPNRNNFQAVQRT